MNKPILFADMEGTIFTKSPIKVSDKVSPSAWNCIANLLGEEALAASLEGAAKWNRGEFNEYVDCMAYSVGNFQNHGLRRETFEEFINSIEYNVGVQDVFEKVRTQYRTVLISGGIKAQAVRAQRDLQLDHIVAGCDILWNEDGLIEHWDLVPCDYEGKRHFMERIIEEHGGNPEDCIFVGDGFNDIPLAQSVGTSIAFNGPPALQEVCTHAINQPEGEEDFREVLQYIPV